VLLDHALNLEDAEMAILRGHFAVMLMLDAPPGFDEAGLRADLERVRTEVPLETVSLNEVPALDTPTAAASHSISVYGADHPGIVHGVAEALGDAGMNVVGLSTRFVGEGSGEPLYVMLLEVALPPPLDEAGLEALLASVARSMVSMSPCGRSTTTSCSACGADPPLPAPSPQAALPGGCRRRGHRAGSRRPRRRDARTAALRRARRAADRPVATPGGGRRDRAPEGGGAATACSCSRTR
jgi:glycine cleavage system transcriptional repressor